MPPWARVIGGVVRRPPSGPAPRVAVHGSWLLPCADTRGDGPLSPAGDYRTAPADTRSDPVLRGGRGYPEPWTRDDERAFGTPSVRAQRVRLMWVW